MKIKNKLSAKVSALIFGSVTLFTNCKKEQQITPNNVNSSMESGASSLRHSGRTAAVISSTAYYLEKSLPIGYVKDGSRDYTSYIQAAVSKYSEIVFPAFPLMVNSNGIKVGSNKILTFLSGSKLILKPTSENYYDIIRVSLASNVTLNDPVIYGDRTKHLSTGGRYGKGVGIYSSTNVTVNNAKIYDTWGDGIYVGRSSSEITYCKNTKIVNASIRGAGRNGISVICSDGLRVEKAYIRGSGLTGFDIEGNYGIEEQKNSYITDVTTELSANNGFAIGLSRTYASRNKTIGTINIINHRDISSAKYSFKVSLKRPLEGTYGTITGTVNVTNPVWIKPGSGRPNHYQVQEPDFRTYVKNPEVQNLSGEWLTDPKIEDLMDMNIRQGFCDLIF